jgi:5-methyltetrahydropteroyltriglutamate--homocysteine methyltransferase
MTLPLLPTVGVGSAAAPGWFLAAQRASRDGAWGAHDIDEMYDDATRLTVLDQIEAGMDILTDGELTRQRFVYEMYGRLSGLARVPARRRLGIAFYDQAPHFLAEGPIAAPGGLGAVAEFRRLKAASGGRPVKIALPGPLTFAGAIRPGARRMDEIHAELVSVINAELRALEAAGADNVQLDEPGLATSLGPLKLEAAADLVNAAFAGIGARTCVHVCFGNNAGRPMAPRTHARLLPAIERLACRQLMLEFANREMAEAEMLGPLARRFEIAAGVIDVKNYHVETPAEVAARLALVLRHVPAARLTVTADCGYSALPRYLAREKMRAMAAGAALARPTAR